MKTLKRLLLINWHNFEFEILDFSSLTFLTGRNATGKSTIIDALQLVILGDSSGNFFNKAASSKSSRNLRGYLYGEQGDDGQSDFNYSRAGQNFSSYVVTLWEDSDNKRTFTTGFMADCYKDRKYENHWFIYQGDFQESTFIDTQDRPFTFDRLKSFINSRKNARTFNINREYQNELMIKLGSINSKYMSLLRKAVPFTPITDIEKFITESICDIDHEVNIEAMQDEIRAYTLLEEQSRQSERRLEKLEEIIAQYSKVQEIMERINLHSYILARASMDKKEWEKKKAEKTLKEKRSEETRLSKDFDSLKKEKEAIDRQLAQKNNEYYSSDIRKKEEEYKKAIAEKKAKIQNIERRLTSAASTLTIYGQALVKALELLNLKESDFYQLALRLVSIKPDRLADIPLNELQKALLKVSDELSTKRASVQIEYNKFTEKISDYKKRISNLERGIKPWPSAAIEFQHKLKANNIESTFLAELIEVEDENWRDTIEAMLSTHRFDLLIQGKDFRKAKDILLSSGAGEHVCIVDADSNNAQTLPYSNSLASILSYHNYGAQNHICSLLNDVSLSECKAIHADREAHFFTGSSLSRLSEEEYLMPFIGKSSFSLLLSRYRGHLNELERDASTLDAELKRLSSVVVEQFADDHKKRVAEDIASEKEINNLESDIAEFQFRLDSLDLFYLDRLKAEIEKLENQSKKINDQCFKINGDLRVVCSDIANLEDNIIPSLTKEIENARVELEKEYDPYWIKNIAEVRYREVINETHSTIPVFVRYENTLKGDKTELLNAESHLFRLRDNYTSTWQLAYDCTREDNVEFQNEYDDLKNNRLPEYLEKIRASKQEAYRQFKEDFISKIKSKIDDVKDQVAQLNSSLKDYVFGRDRYRFEIKPNPDYRRYYDMFVDPLLLDIGDGPNIGTEAFMSKYQVEIEDLFSRLVIMDENKSNAERMAEHEKNIKRFTDYRTYLVFDLIVTDNEIGNEQRLSKTMGKKSGGETQLPFYIALLAAFSQVCRIHQKKNNTVRLVIFDEAFSKMDAERIRESIRLLRSFGLQAIFSAPSDKLADIAMLVDRVLITYRDKYHSYVKSYEPGELGNAIRTRS